MIMGFEVCMAMIVIVILWGYFLPLGLTTTFLVTCLCVTEPSS
jgi:hypothetical protein